MTPGINKRTERKDNKLRKISALFEIAKLNDEDRRKAMKRDAAEEKEEGECDDDYHNSRGFKRPRHCLRGSPARWCPPCIPPKRHFTRSCGDRIDPINPPPSTLDSKTLYDCTQEEACGVWKSDCSTVEMKKKDNLSEKQIALLKQHLKARKKLLKSLPRLHLTEAGINAELIIPNGQRTPLFFNDIQQLILYAQSDKSTHFLPRFCQLEHPTGVSNMTVVIAKSISLLDYLSVEAQCPNLKVLQYKLEVIPPLSYGGSIEEELSVVPLCRSLKNQVMNLGMDVDIECRGLPFHLVRGMFPILSSRTNAGLAATVQKSEEGDGDGKRLPPSDKFPRTQLLLSPSQMVAESYPFPLKGELMNKYAHYKMSRDSYEEVTPNSPMWGLDCEMCQTQAGQELTRVSIVNEKLKVVYETFVMPHNRIIDYLTRYSGITEDSLRGVTKRLVDVQQELQELFPPDVILVGQSLNSDLDALQLMHPYCIDTSVVFNITGVRFRKTKLKTLSEMFLAEKIQCHGEAGHDSVEDSVAALKLIQLKLANSLEFGDAVLNGPTSTKEIAVARKKKAKVDELDKAKNSVTKDDAPAQSNNYSGDIGCSIFSLLASNPSRTASIVGRSSHIANFSKFLLSRDGKPLINCQETKLRNVLSETTRLSSTSSFTLALWRQRKTCLEPSSALLELDSWVGKHLSEAPECSLLVVILAGTSQDKSLGACFMNLKRPSWYGQKCNVNLNSAEALGN